MRLFTLFIILIFLLKYIPLSGQTKLSGKTIGTITLTVLDSVTLKHLGYATVELWLSEDNNKPIGGGLTNNKGKFQVSVTEYTSYTIKISHIGYVPKIIHKVTIFKEQKTVDLGEIKLSMNSSLLSEVTVKNNRSEIDYKIDRTVFHVGRDISSAVGSAVDILRKMPMLTVDLEENVQLWGNSNISLLVNGRPSGIAAGRLSDLLRSIPGSQIKSIEVITSPSAKYDAEGSSGIINIITYKSSSNGLLGSLSTTIGTRSENWNVNLSGRHNRFSFSLNAGGYYNPLQNGYQNYLRQNSAGGNQMILKQNGTYIRSRLGYYNGFTIAYSPRKDIHISSNLSIGGNKMYNKNEVLTSFANINNMIENGIRLTRNTNSSLNMSGDFSMRKQFKIPKHELEFALQYGNTFVNTIYETQETILGVLENAKNKQQTHENTIQVDYTFPFNDSLTLETGLKSTKRKFSGNDNFLVFDSSNQVYIADIARENLSIFNQNIYAGYAIIEAGLPNKYSIKAGMRYEFTTTHAEDRNKTFLLNSNYANFFPSVSLFKKIKKGSIRFGYSKRIQRPGIYHLNLFVHAADPRNVLTGNRELKPELSNLYELNLNYNKRNLNVSLSLYMKSTKNIIESYQEFSSDTKTITRFLNIDDNISAGINGFVSFQITKNWTSRLNYNTFNYTSKTRLNTNFISNSGLMFNGFLNSSFQFTPKIKSELAVGFNSPRIIFRGVYRGGIIIT